MLAVPIGLVACGVASADDIQERPEHPLLPVLRMAQERLDEFENQVRDYRCRLVKRELVDGRVSDCQHLVLKLRHEQAHEGEAAAPFSVYARFVAPAELEGREVVYVRGRYDGKLIGRRGGRRFDYLTLAVDPESELAMQHNRYPVTEIGIANLMRRLLEVGAQELQYDECEVEYFTGARVEGRPCTLIQVTHPVARDHFRYHVARIFIDDQWQLPIRYASYDWPPEADQDPPLLEEYTYLDLEFNVGFSDWDFDHRNEAYGFRKDFEP
jgi:hypothetical protein